MPEAKFTQIVRELIANYTNEHSDSSDKLPPLKPSDVYIVWMCKTLQNTKALASTPRPDGMYYEITYNGDKDELYFDAYKKFENRCIRGKQES